MRVAIPSVIESHPYLLLLYENLSKQGVEIYDLKNKIEFLINLRKINIIHFHWIEFYLRSKSFLITLLKFPAFFLFLMFTKLLGKKIVITLHNVEPHERLHPFLEHIGFKRCLGMADAIIVHNNYSKNKAKVLYGVGREKIHIIPHGNFISYYSNSITKKEAKEILEIPKDKFILLFFGMIRPYKGIDALINVSNQLLGHISNLFIMFVGKCEDETLKLKVAKFSHKFKNNCFVKLEHIPDGEIQIYMNAAEVGILPYQEITTPGSMLLFMSFGKPIIVPNLEPIKEILGEEGIYYKVENNESLKNAIINSKNLDLKKISRRVLKKTREYNWEKIVRKTVKVYKSI